MPITAAEIMTSPPIVIGRDASVAEVASLLTRHAISAVPVCAADGTLVGIVSEGDILKPFRESVRLRRDWWLGLLADGEDLPQQFLDYIRRDTRTVADLMTRPVFTAGENATLPELAELMTKHGVKRIPIVRDGKVVGIVSRANLVAALARAPAMLV